MKTCFKCGLSDNVELELLNRQGTYLEIKPMKFVKHHISYNPEVVVDCCNSCHTKIHHRLRKEGKCKIPAKELALLSQKSNSFKRTLIESNERCKQRLEKQKISRHNAGGRQNHCTNA